MYVKKLMLMALALVLLAGCGADQSLEGLRKGLERYPEYSVILSDMDSRGLFAKDYLHRYRVIFAKNGARSDGNAAPEMGQKITDWVKVDPDTYQRYQDALGMTILAKKRDGSVETVPQPPAFQYVGDPRFGQWQQGSDGSQVWAWLAAGAVLSEVVDEIGDVFEKKHRRIDYRDWQDYRKSTSQRQPYYGRKDSQGRSQFGTSGQAAQKSNPGFFERQQARMAERKEGFAQKVESRMGRSKVAGSSSFSKGFSTGRKFKK